MEQQVVIAGGGPVGLWLAAELRLGGVTVTVVEERRERDQRSKALTLHPRTLEILASRGAHGPFLEAGTPLPGGHFGGLGTRLDFRVLDTPFPYTLALPQARTEEFLEARALALGARLLRGHRVTGLTRAPDAVTVHIRGPEGPYALRAAYAVGCDGVRSTVRAAAGIGFPGTPATVLGFLADVRLDGPPPPGFSVCGPSGGLMAVQLPGGPTRLVGITPDDLTATWPGDLTLDELRTKVRAITGRDFGLRDPVWLSRFGNATRQADRYRDGRVLLAGDAAHQHFPTGGVGMNVGIQDAHNLGWKLAAVLAGRAGGTLLDSYHDERHPVGARLLESSRAQTALMTAFSPEGLALRAELSALLAAQPALNATLAERVSGLAVGYPPADPAAHPLTGTRAPDLAVEGSEGLFSLLRPGRPLLLDLAGDTPAGSSAPGTVRHTGVLLRPPSAWAGVRAALIRPDGHVAWARTGRDRAAEGQSR
ncbi:FAD-dependent monooxygenase [Streptomyces sp. NPDC038707]|uniref:FAD-dependent monooxygenase n=1 Tax=Streptomyces sp. NPDC038707 TaxID=3154329 RepID=UPI0033FCF896